MRLDKLLEQEKFGSRRQVKALIRGKQVTIDGKVVMAENQNVDASLQKIFVKNRQIIHSGHTYYMLNKPKGLVTAVKDKNCKTVLDLLEEKDQQKGLFPVGRLDRDTEGLLLLTNNGQLAYQLVMPHKHVEKCYRVLVNAQLTEEDCISFKQGIVFSDQTQCKPAFLTILHVTPEKSEALLTISEGKFHQIKKMFLSVGKKVIGLKRVSMGPLWLDDTLQVGGYRPLTEKELSALTPYFTAHKKEKR